MVPRRYAGFTLLEILIVLVLSSVLLGFVAPNLYKAIAGTELSTTTKELSSALKKSRRQAINRSQEVSFTINVEKRYYQLNGEGAVQPLAKDIDITVLTGTDLIKGSKGAIVFYPDGSSSGGLITIQQGQRQQQVDINWLTGEVLIKKHG